MNTKNPPFDLGVHPHVTAGAQTKLRQQLLPESLPPHLTAQIIAYRNHPVAEPIAQNVHQCKGNISLLTIIR